MRKTYRISYYNYNFRLKKMGWKYQGEWNIDNIKEFADRAMAMEGLMRIEGIRIIDKESKEIVLETVR